MIDSPLAEIQKLAGDDIEVIYDEAFMDVDRANLGATTIKARKYIPECTDDDLVLFFISSQNAETEGLDRYSMHFENYIDEIIRIYSLKCKNVAVIMQTGTSYLPYRWEKTTGSIVQMWLAGESGGKAIADVLFGKVNPSGKLGETFPNKLRENFEHIGLGSSIIYEEGFEVGYRYYDKHPEEIWYPFGHGLSYTQFEYSNLQTNVENDNLKLEFNIKNTGDVFGKETAQIYIGKKKSFFKRPVKELKAFDKVSLDAGETTLVSIEIPLSDLAVYNTALSVWEVEKGEYQVYIGASSQDIKLTASFEI